jgi:hypothetical protein
MTITVFAFIITLASIANYVLFLVLPTAMMQWMGFWAQLVLILIAAIVIGVMVTPNDDVSKRVFTRKKLTLAQLAIVAELVVAVLIAIVMFVTLS